MPQWKQALLRAKQCKNAIAGALLGASVTLANATTGFTVPAVIGDAEDFMHALGVAVFGVIVAIAIWKWAKRAT